MRIRLHKGSGHFLCLWLGQVVSLTGSGITSFSLGVWVYRETGSITQFSLISLFAILPGVIFSPIAGQLADRFDRRYLVLISDSCAAISTLLIGYMFTRGSLQIEYIYLAASLTSIFNAIQWPAWLAMITGMVNEKNRGRSNGWLQFGHATSSLAAPLLAGAMGGSLGLEAVFLLDFGSFLFALLTLIMVRPERKAPQAAEQKNTGGVWHGVRFIFSTRGLLALLMLNMFSNFLMAMVEVLGRPMILSGHDDSVLGGLLAIGGIGMLSGSMLMGIWGGPKCKLKGVVTFQIALGACLILMGLANSLFVLGSLIFLFYLLLPISTGSNLAIWQEKVPNEVRGRVFAAQRAVNWSMRPLAYVSAGPLVERLLLPILHGGPIAGSQLARLFLKTGGIGLVFVLMGAMTILITGASWFNPKLRDLGWCQRDPSFA